MNNKFSNIKERILYLVEYHKDMKDDFFKEIGMTYGNFKGENKKTPINSNALVNILSKYVPAGEWIDAGDWFHEASAAIRHYGDSMIEYPSGCILVLKKVEDMRLLLGAQLHGRDN